MGQIHGIGLIQVSDEAFGRPIRVMCSAYLGTEGVINLEREALMSGRIHNKGFLILSGYLGRTFARSKPLLLSASLSFDQLYEEIEGDSASAAELYALLSAISGVPIRQDLCITGAINQDGTILPVGGVTEKVEGVFAAFEQIWPHRGAGRDRPRKNVENLVLRRKVRDAVAEGRFHLYAIDRIEEGWPILTGYGGRRDGGRRDVPGRHGSQSGGKTAGRVREGMAGDGERRVRTGKGRPIERQVLRAGGGLRRLPALLVGGLLILNTSCQAIGGRASGLFGSGEPGPATAEGVVYQGVLSMEGSEIPAALQLISEGGRGSGESSRLPRWSPKGRGRSVETR